MSCWQKKKDKKEMNNHEIKFLTTDSTQRRGFSDNRFITKNKKVSDMRSLMACLSLLGFLCILPGYCLRPAALLLLSPCAFAPDRHATGLLLDPGGDYARFMQFLPLSIFSIARLPFPITLNRWSSPSLSPLLRFVINW